MSAENFLSVSVTTESPGEMPTAKQKDWVVWAAQGLREKTATSQVRRHQTQVVFSQGTDGEMQTDFTLETAL